MTHPGVGPLTALAYELVIGNPERFHCGKQIASDLGLVPEERSSGERRRLGPSASKATCCSGFCWWKRRRSRCAANRSGAASVLENVLDTADIVADIVREGCFAD